jgi:hypothetical protein
MHFTKKNWVWTIVFIATVIFCTSILILHIKNWVGNNDNSLRLRSGFYAVEIPYTQMDSIAMVDRIPPMERLHGFSALEKEKGVFRQFKDSLTDKKIHVFVDNIHQQKVKLVYKDSTYVYFNLKDSVETIQLMDRLKLKISSPIDPN